MVLLAFGNVLGGSWLLLKESRSMSKVHRGWEWESLNPCCWYKRDERERSTFSLMVYILHIYGVRKLLLPLIVGSYRERVDGECAEPERAESKGCYEKSSSFSLGPNSCAAELHQTRACSSAQRSTKPAAVPPCCFIRNKQPRPTREYCWNTRRERASDKILCIYMPICARMAPGGNSKEKATSPKI